MAWPPAPGRPGCRLLDDGTLLCTCPMAGVGALAAGDGARFTLQLAAVTGEALAVELRSAGCINEAADCSGARGDTNDEHPLAYTQVQRSLGAQNFVFQPRVDAVTPAPCPADATVNGLLVAHLPLPAL